MADAINLASQLSLKRVINLFLLEFSYGLARLIRRPVLFGQPAFVSIEPSALCNLRCPECFTGNRQLTRPTGIIPSSLFQSVTEQLSPSVVYMNLYFQGEPYLHPGFTEMVEYAESAGIYTAASTNGHFLSDEIIKATLRSGLDRLIVSLDGVDQETYEKYRRGGDFETVRSGIRRLVELRQELSSRKPFLILQFIVFSTNEHQLEDIRKLASELGVDKLDVKTAQLQDFYQGHTLLPKNPKLSRYRRFPEGHYLLKKAPRNRCHRMWTGCVITWDGLVVPCCFDKDADHILGDLKTDDFKSIWRGKAYRDFRSAILARRSKIDICMNCTE